MDARAPRVSGRVGALCAALDADERAQLAALLRRMADQQGLVAGVHPGFTRLGRKPPGA